MPVGFSGGQAVHEGEQHAGQHEGQVQADFPGQLLVGVAFDVDKSLEQFDAGNRDDGADQLDLQMKDAA